MKIRNILTSGAMCATLAICGGALAAQPAETLEDATTMADEAAEAEAMAAEAVAEGQAEKLQEEADIEKADIRGEPMEEVEVSGEN